MAEVIQPIIIKKCRAKKHAAHSTSWKVALADFMTALMTLFLLLWLLASTTQSQRESIALQFQFQEKMDAASKGKRGLLDSGSGSSNTLMDLGGRGREIDREIEADDREEITDIYKKVKTEKQKMKRLKRNIERTISRSKVMSKYKGHIKLALEPDGLKVHVVDKENKQMFKKGGGIPKEFTRTIIKQLGTTINRVPNKIAIFGHTDSAPFQRINYSNWELSADRANAARRALVKGGIKESQIDRVVGLASTRPYDPENPEASVNRRISILVMNEGGVDKRFMLDY
ncbi:MAG: flagellar motor protein MotB [Gammaproteobacteria bacterium]|nr:flagellar motor protein MotB [Gammaproteobacteria bacterium]MBT7308725.1 flagellar motor protein MotB [Gammaproteobacteria bacterium]